MRWFPDLCNTDWSRSGKATVLQDTGGQGSSQLVAINGAGWSVGFSNIPGGQDAVLWLPLGKATVLQDAGGHGNSYVLAINAFGWSVAVSYTASPTQCSGRRRARPRTLAQSWGRPGAVRKLSLSTISATLPDTANTRAASTDFCSRLTESILGRSRPFPPRGSPTPVPEPSTWVTMLIGFAGLGFFGRRSRTSKPVFGV